MAFAPLSGRIIRALPVVAAVALSTPAARADDRGLLLAQINAHPTDYDATFAYVRASTAARDDEAAISALERLLFFNPALTRAKYELGNLYMRLGSNAMAARYFGEALAAGDLDPDLRVRAETYLPLAKKELQPDRVYGLLEAGAAYNSNPGGLPPASLIASNLLTVPIGAGNAGRGVGMGFGLFDARFVHDFQNERGDTFEAHVQGYATAQFGLSALNVGLANLSAGPRLAIAPEVLPGWTIHPYGAYSLLSVNGSVYATTQGAGVSIGAPLTRWFSLEPGVEWASVLVNDSFARVTDATLNSGVEWTGSLAAKWSASDVVTVKGRVFASTNRTSDILLASSQQGVEASIKFDFDPPVSGIPLLWSITPFARYTTVAFDRVNAFAQELTPRRDTLWRAGGQLDMPLNAWLGLTALAQYENNRSNDVQFGYSAWTASLGATVRF